jgi:hypothetical protein
LAPDFANAPILIANFPAWHDAIACPKKNINGDPIPAHRQPDLLRPQAAKNDEAVDRMCASIREFGFEIPCLVRSDSEVIDGHLRLKTARQLGITEIPVILCDEWKRCWKGEAL